MHSAPRIQPSNNTRVWLLLEINGLWCTRLGTYLLWPPRTHLPTHPIHNAPAIQASSCSSKKPTCSYLRAFALAAPSAKNSLLLTRPSHDSGLRINHLFTWAFSDPNQCHATGYLQNSYTTVHSACPPHPYFISSLTFWPIRNVVLVVYLFICISLGFH